MSWVTTKDGRKVNTDWFDKEHQISYAQREAQKRNNLEMTEEERENLLKSKLLTEDSYMNSPEYKRLDKEVQNSGKEMMKLKERMSELRKTMDEHTSLSPEAKGKPSILRSLYTIEDEVAKKARKEFNEIYDKEREYEKKWESACEKLKEYEQSFHEKQKALYLKEKTTISKDVKSDYKGFEKDTHISHYQDLLKSGKAEIVEMSPEQYLKECGYFIFPKSTYERQVETVVADSNVTFGLADKMKSGVKMYMPMLNYKDKEQEGRHRAAAAILLGIERIPVLIVR